MTITITRKIHFQTAHRSKKTIRSGAKPKPKKRTQRISKLMAMAICFKEILNADSSRDMADLAVAGQVSRARMSQIMNMNLLAPSIQKELIALPKTTSAIDIISIIKIQKIALEPDWQLQRKMWEVVSCQNK